MARGTARRYRRWFDYEKDSHAKVLEAFAAAAPAARRTKEFRKAVTLAGHIAASRQIWLRRLGAAARAPSEFFPAGLTLEALGRRFEKMHAAWTAFLSTATDEDLARTFEYRSTEGIRYRDAVEDILTQLHGHSLYHRGQIALLLRSAGAEPPVTDFVFWTRRPVFTEEKRARRPHRRR